MSRMYIIGVLMTLACVFRATAQDITPPDFAYPKTVSKTSLESLDKAIGRHDSQQIIRSLIDYTLACQAIGSGELPLALARIDSVKRVCADNVPVCALADLFEAQIYSNTYTARMPMYDKRKLPLSPMPSDYTEWSGAQFRTVISALLDNAVAHPDKLKDISLEKYTGVITQTAGTRVYFPSLYDFIATRAADIMRSWGNDTMYATLNRGNSAKEKILRLYDSQISVVNPCSAPSVRARLDKLAFEIGTSPDMDPESIAEAYMALYTSMCGSDGVPANEYAGDVLIAMPRPSAPAQAKEMFRTAEAFLRAYPQATRRNCISNIIAGMSGKSISLSCPTVYGPGMEMTFDVTLRNASKASIKIYNVSSSPVHQSNYMVKRGQKLPATPVAVLPVETSAGSYPYENTVSVSYSFPAKGNYIAVPVIEGIKPDRHNYSKIHITGVTLAMSSFDENRLWAVNPSNGEPLKYVTLQLTNTQRATPVTKAIGKTGADGSLKSTGSGTVTAILGNDRYAAPLYTYSNIYKDPGKWVEIPEIFTSLPVYHPGDTIDWTAVCYEYNGGLRRVLSEKKRTAILYDPSGEAVDTITAITDSYGRIHSRFPIPSSALTGSFFISMGNRWSGTHVNVADYKLPTFEVVMDNVERGVPSAGTVTLHGKAMTYSGMPLGGCSATLDLSVMQRPRWWGGGRSIDIYTDSVTTLPDGSFSFIVPAKALESVPFKNAFYSGTVTVVSSTGESHTATRSFSKGTRYMIHADVANNTDITSGPKSFNVRVTDYMDSTVNIPVNLDILRNDISVMRTAITGTTSGIDLSSLAPGEYKLAFTLSDPSLADTLRCQTVMYNPSARVTPVPDQLLWSPCEAMETDGKWLFAVNADTHLNVTIWADGKILSQKWHKVPAGMQSLDVSLPEGITKGTMTVTCAANYTMAETSVSLTRKDPADGIEITTESFRDHLIPGATETWRFKIVDKSGLGREAAVIAGMYNTALDAIARSDWEFTPLRGYTPPFTWNYPDINSRISEWISQDVKYLDCPQAATAEFNTYGIRTGMPGGGMFTTMYRKNARSAQLMSVTEHSEEVVVEEMASAMDSDGATADSGMRIRGANAGTAETTDEAAAENQESEFEYRDNETPLAFFRPMLVTDSDGGLVLQFSVPDANARWKFQAIAFTESLLTARLSSAAVSSKPVMVQPNLPRFLRTGDSVSLMASVMNNSDDTSVISTAIELFNPADGRIIGNALSTDTVKPHANATVSIAVKVDGDLRFIGYRIKSSASGHTDGEQTLIPVLPAVSPVIETQPFYMAPDQKSITIDLPDAPADAVMTLQFCENPAWYVATTLPGLIDKEASTAPEAALSIFSASVADGLLREYPAIADAIREWTDSDKSAETLQSMLSRNEDLKIMLLSATPWMPDAGNDTERMARLALLFDGNTIRNAISTNIAMLQSLGSDNGGWSWCRQYSRPSQWATRKVLSLMGQLNEMGYLPADAGLRGMIISALRWDNTEASTQYLRYPESDFTSYVRLHDMFRTLRNNPAPDSRIVNSTVNRIVKGWKKSSLGNKAMQAVVLYQNSYPTLARTILGSIREFAKSDPAKGMWYPSLDGTWYNGLDKVGITARILRAFQLIEPGCSDVEMLTQWLILQKGAQNWGSGEIASAAVSAILHSNSRWFVPASDGADVSVNGRKLPVPAGSRYTGEFTMPLPQGSASHGLTIERSSATPSWGATYTRYDADMSTVSAASCPELSITKEFSSPRLRLGDKVSVILTLKVNADMDYVCIRDERAACLEPVDQLSGHLYSEGLVFYRENRNSETRIFIDHLPKGTYVLSYDMWINNTGTYSSGIATIQSQYAPQFTAHSSGRTLDVTE